MNVENLLAKLKKTDTHFEINNLLLIASVVACLLFSRIEEITGIYRISKALDYFFWAYFIYSLILLLLRNLRFAPLFVVAGLVVVHAYCTFFQPSLLSSVPRQDFMLSETVSANHSFMFAKLFVRNSILFLPGSILFWLTSKAGVQRKLLIAIAGASLINLIVCLIQGYISPDFLAAGSGTALSHDRAPALLRDSGNSGVILAMLFSAVAAVGLTHKSGRMKLKILYAFLFVTLFVLVAFTQGRIFFFSTILSFLCLAWVFSLQKIGFLKTAAITALSLIIVHFTVLQFVNSPIEKHYGRFLRNFSGKKTETIRHAAKAIDETRAAHVVAAWHAVEDKPVIGNGLGSFFEIYDRYKDKVLLEYHFRGRTDLPSNFYLELVSGLGVSGLTFILISLFFFFVYLSKVDFKKLSREQALVLGSALSLLVSFLIGSHVVFISVMALFSLSVGFVLKQSYGRLGIGLFLGLALLMSCQIVYLLATAPNQVEFRWKERGIAQLPVPINVPIATPDGGHWMANGSSFLVATESPMLFFELPSEYYPIEPTLVVKNNRDEVLQTIQVEPIQFNQEKPGTLVEISLNPETIEYCTKDISISQYCYIESSIQKPWTFADYKIGFAHVK